MAAMMRGGVCIICGISPFSHQHTQELHSFNHVLYEYNNYRKALVKNRNGIKITQEIMTEGLSPDDYEFIINKGKFVVKLSSEKVQNLQKRIKFKFVITNERKDDVLYMVRCGFLLCTERNNVYRVEDPQNVVSNGKFLELHPQESYPVYVYFEPNVVDLTEYVEHLAFKFQDPKANQYTFFRTLMVVVQDYQPIDEAIGSTHFKGEYWADNVRIIPANPKPFVKGVYSIPTDHFKAIYCGLKITKDTEPEQREIIKMITNFLGTQDKQTGDYISKLSSQNYDKFFHYLLWLDEACQALSLRQYNLSNVTMCIPIANTLELVVDGLAEKRPSLMVGDVIIIRLHRDHTAYEGVIKSVNDRTIWIHNVDPILLDMVEANAFIEFDVAFKLGRLTYERKHSAVDLCIKKDLRATLFPDVALRNRIIAERFNISNIQFYNDSIYVNPEQRKAVLSILNDTAFPAPYILFGPPGTGKTVTIVEAILQITKHKPSEKILICAPSNAACDMLTIKLAEVGNFQKGDLLRIHAESRTWEDVPSLVKRYSNHDGIHYTRLEPYQLSKHKIIITTLVLIGKFTGKYIPDYVFIDEAAQAPEPEAAIAISMVLTAKIIIAGDPQQLGPVCQSKVAERKGLSLSILERLMNMDLYQSDNEGKYDERFISMLKLNYRSHPFVLHVPNDLFYEGKLRAVNKKAENDPISRLCVPNLFQTGQHKRQGFPVEFYSVIAKEQRNGKSPSYFNQVEISVVIKYVTALMQQNNIRVEQEDIGIISPYIRQVHRIKHELKNRHYPKIEVGTTEAYQGSEKRIIIITTVRGQSDLLLYDAKYDLGFVKNAKRMNVALTRAMSKLIVVGNPMVLNTDHPDCENWRYLIRYCEENNSVFGVSYQRRDVDLRKKITHRLSKYQQRNGTN
nr:putative helicase mov-10-B.1 [Onthophagus taurus]